MYFLFMLLYFSLYCIIPVLFSVIKRIVEMLKHGDEIEHQTFDKGQKSNSKNIGCSIYRYEIDVRYEI